MIDSIILDFENETSTFNSLNNIWNASQDEITSFLKSKILKKKLEDFPSGNHFHDVLFKEFNKEFDSDFSKKITAYWFHNTRVTDKTDFKEGILPLDKMVDKVHNQINNFITDLNLTTSNKSLEESSMIQRKLNSNYDNGPWGFLIRNFALEKVDGIHNYLSLPEIVEDIVYYKYPFNQAQQILKEFKNATVPCIVKFKSSKEIHPEKLSSVINYLFHKLNNEKIDGNCNSNISLMGEKINFDSIIKIEFLEKHLA
tara:strand:+ start:62 stop:829 length:768 start_codon:yes stop_codon:yes gene_type:complete